MLVKNERQTMGVPIMGSLLITFIGSLASDRVMAIATASTAALVGGVKSTFLVATAITSLSVVAAIVELWRYRHEERK